MRNFYFAPKSDRQNERGKKFIDTSKGNLSVAPTGKTEDKGEDYEGEEKA
jgi:hypothetical protein